MKFKTLIATLVLAVTPGLALAQPESCGRDHAANVCATGLTWDDATQSCVEVVSS